MWSSAAVRTDAFTMYCSESRRIFMVLAPKKWPLMEVEGVSRDGVRKRSSPA
jgi:hypothetical protein